METNNIEVKINKNGLHIYNCSECGSEVKSYGMLCTHPVGLCIKCYVKQILDDAKKYKYDVAIEELEEWKNEVCRTK